MKLRVTPLTGSIGAAVEGVRLDEPVDGELFEALRAAFREHCTLVFRDQYVKPLAQIEFARLWGEPVVTEMLNPLDGHPEIYQVANVKKETTATEAWHYDGSFTAAPPKISMLSAITTPVGGDTMWSNQYLAYERLSPAMKDTLNGLKVRFRGVRLGRMLNVADEDTPTAVHPLVRTHPETGRKALFVGHRENASIDGWTRQEMRAPAGIPVPALGHPGQRLPPRMARRRLRHVGQPVHHALRDPRLRHPGTSAQPHHPPR